MLGSEMEKLQLILDVNFYLINEIMESDAWSFNVTLLCLFRRRYIKIFKVSAIK